MTKRISRIGAERIRRVDVAEGGSEIWYLEPPSKPAHHPKHVRRREPWVMQSVLVWCAVLVFLVATVALLLWTLGEITRRLIALGERDPLGISADP